MTHVGVPEVLGTDISRVLLPEPPLLQLHLTLDHGVEIDFHRFLVLQSLLVDLPVPLQLLLQRLVVFEQISQVALHEVSRVSYHSLHLLIAAESAFCAHFTDGSLDGLAGSR